MGLLRGPVFHHCGVPENCMPSSLNRESVLPNGPFSPKLAWAVLPLENPLEWMGSKENHWTTKRMNNFFAGLERPENAVDLKTRKRCNFLFRAPKNRCDFSATSAEKPAILPSCDLQTQRFFCGCDFFGTPSRGLSWDCLGILVLRSSLSPQGNGPKEHGNNFWGTPRSPRTIPPNVYTIGNKIVTVHQ